MIWEFRTGKLDVNINKAQIKMLMPWILKSSLVSLVCPWARRLSFKTVANRLDVGLLWPYGLTAVSQNPRYLL